MSIEETIIFSYIHINYITIVAIPGVRGKKNWFETKLATTFDNKHNIVNISNVVKYYFGKMLYEISLPLLWYIST